MGRGADGQGAARGGSIWQLRQLRAEAPGLQAAAGEVSHDLAAG